MTLMPSFNLKAVVRQTGIKPDTLRAWERRYGLPQPERSDGHQRLYTPRDVQVIQWLLARQREGLTIKRAVDLWRQMEAGGQDPLAANSPTAGPAAPTRISSAAGTTLVGLCDAWIAACLAFDEQAAEQVSSQAFALYPPETVCLELLRSGIADIGRRWYEGEATVQQEHFATALAARRVEALLLAVPAPTRPGRLLVACPPDEEHTLGVLLLTLILRRKGWSAVYLGANVPAERLEATVAATRPSLVILAAQRLQAAAGLLEAARVLHRAGVPLAFGGLVFNVLPNLAGRIPGHFLGRDLEDAAATVEALMPNPALPAPPRAGDAHQEQRMMAARDQFRQRRALIESQAAGALATRGLMPDVLRLAGREIGQGIVAALTLGDIHYLGADMEWLAGLLRNYSVPASALAAFVRAYHGAAESQLDEAGAPIVEWLEDVCASLSPGGLD